MSDVSKPRKARSNTVFLASDIRISLLVGGIKSQRDAVGDSTGFSGRGGAQEDQSRSQDFKGGR